MERYKRVFDRHGYRCVYCEVPLWEDLRVWHCSTEDHLYPKKYLGSDSVENLVAACQLCNSLKGDFVPELAKRPGVVFETGIKRKEVSAEFKTAYIESIRVWIGERRRERMDMFNDERLRIGRQLTTDHA